MIQSTHINKPSWSCVYCHQTYRLAGAALLYMSLLVNTDWHWLHSGSKISFSRELINVVLSSSSEGITPDDFLITMWVCLLLWRWYSNRSSSSLNPCTKTVCTTTPRSSSHVFHPMQPRIREAVVTGLSPWFTTCFIAHRLAECAHARSLTYDHGRRGTMAGSSSLLRSAILLDYWDRSSLSSGAEHKPDTTTFYQLFEFRFGEFTKR